MRSVPVLICFLLLVPGCATRGPIHARGILFGPELYLSDATGKTLFIDVYYPAGKAPYPEALASLVQHLQKVVPKHVVVGNLTEFPPELGARKWSSQEVQDFGGSLLLRSDTTPRITLLYISGKISGEDPTLLGLAFTNYAAILVDSIRQISVEGTPVEIARPDGGRALEAVVAFHESGHLIGLVNAGLPMVRDHVDHGEDCQCHSASMGSVMYGGSERIGVAGQSIGTATEFDADDLADIKAYVDAHRA